MGRFKTGDRSAGGPRSDLGQKPERMIASERRPVVCENGEDLQLRHSLIAVSMVGGLMSTASTFRDRPAATTCRGHRHA